MSRELTEQIESVLGISLSGGGGGGGGEPAAAAAL